MVKSCLCSSVNLELRKAEDKTVREESMDADYLLIYMGQTLSKQVHAHLSMCIYKDLNPFLFNAIDTRIAKSHLSRSNSDPSLIAEYHYRTFILTIELRIT